ncbi:IclR family transcriptional regulator [Roseomonas sp. SSH11]|uniref:IclR family transcriptional regulator n=1 Tax=Pararoseomonas baculiformis TaxID=2820812 RepID=A0ABS4AIN5_9PROT|nr:IclR family transcriptional regulator [Pararoseomonas baculiformis]MBP0446897.1 IclR family transcriptional regulator [Pararoseomonas baculiformis]
MPDGYEAGEESGEAAESGVRPLASALKTLALLDHLGQVRQPVRLATLSRQLGAGRATIYQRLVTLMAAGWVEQTSEGYFRLTLRAARVAQAATEQAGLGARTLPVLEQLSAETGEAASLAVLEGDLPCIVQRVEPQGVLRVEMRVGATMDLAGSASGRVLLAHLDPARARRLAPELDPAILAAVRESGHSISSGQTMEGIRAAAVPVFGHDGACAAALSLVAPVQRFAPDGWIQPLRAAADALRAIMEGRTA